MEVKRTASSSGVEVFSKVHLPSWEKDYKSKDLNGGGSGPLKFKINIGISLL